MRKNHVRIITLAFAMLILLPGAGGQAVAQAAKAAYPAMAPLDQYLISDEQSEIALAHSAAPSSISDGAEVMVLEREGYKTEFRSGQLSTSYEELRSCDRRCDSSLCRKRLHP